MYLHFIQKTRQRLIHIEKLIAGFSLLLLLCLSLTQVFLRNIFEFGFADFDVISRHLVLFITFMGAALASEGKQHIKIDCVASVISERLKQALKQPLLIASSTISGVFFYYAIQFWISEYEYAPDNEQLALYLALILPIGFFTLSLHFLLLALTHNTDVSSTVEN